MKDTLILRDDEFCCISRNLRMNTESEINKINSVNAEYDSYKNPKHNKALLKIYGDLELAIRKRKYIRFKCLENDHTHKLYDVIPYAIRYRLGSLYFIGYKSDENKVLEVKLEKIDSFEILRDQKFIEKKKADTYIRADTEDDSANLYHRVIEIIVECLISDYEVLCNTFNTVEILSRKGDNLKVSIKSKENDFILRYLMICKETITILKPEYIKNKLVLQADIIINKYGGKNSGKKDKISP